MTDIAREIAGSLTKAQRTAMVRRSHQCGAAVIIEWFGTNGLAQSAFDRMMTRLYLEHHQAPIITPYVHGGWELTPLGLAVRAILQATPHG